LSNSNKKLTLSASTAEERKSWINDISALIKEANQRKIDTKRGSDKDSERGAPPSGLLVKKRYELNAISN
jgi:hypothetical protein